MSEPHRYRKQSVEVEALQYVESNVAALHDFVGDRWQWRAGVPYVLTLEGDMRVGLSDWVIKGVQGEFYPCKPGIFSLTYEPFQREGSPQ